LENFGLDLRYDHLNIAIFMDIIKHIITYWKKLIECIIFVANIDRLVVYTSKLLDSGCFIFQI